MRVRVSVRVRVGSDITRKGESKSECKDDSKSDSKGESKRSHSYFSTISLISESLTFILTSTGAVFGYAFNQI